MKISLSSQIQRLNNIVSKVKELQTLDKAVLSYKASTKEWNIIEVLEHLNLAYDVYRPQIDKVLPGLSEIEEENDVFNTRTVPSLLIKMIRPDGDKRNWKMKTLNKFTPQFEQATLENQEIEQAYSNFFNNQNHLKQTILSCRKKKVREKKIVSALGPLVMFYLPECTEFMVSHIERHMVQIDQILDKSKETLSLKRI